MYEARYRHCDHLPPMDVPVMLTMSNGVEFVGRRVFVEDDDGCAWAWATEDENEPSVPKCWSNGVCWGRNDCGVPSEQPMSWRHLASANEGKYHATAHPNAVRR